MIDSFRKDTLLEGHTGTYRVLKPLGLAGATAQVFLIKREEDDKNFALKIMHDNLSTEVEERFKDEMMVLMRLKGYEDKTGRHYIPKIIECSDLQEEKTQRLKETLGGNPFIIMDFAVGTDVATLLKEKGRLPESDAVEIISQFSEVLCIIHGEDITYTDMKLDNLIWDTQKRHLTVIDWNVFAKNRLDEDAPRDRLYAALYLFQMIAGFPIELKKDPKEDTKENLKEYPKKSLQIASQNYRKNDAFKQMTEGTRYFLNKAFHPDLKHRHGSGGSQITCTKEFRKELEGHARRLDTSADELFRKGGSAFEDRQWLEALKYLDVADHKSHGIFNQDRYQRLQEMLEKAREQVEKSGRHFFHSGRGRYSSGLFSEALEDFEQAMKDDPFDEEARFYAILTCLARHVDKNRYDQMKGPLEEIVHAIAEDHLGQAESAFKPLEQYVTQFSELDSIKTEIEIRKALKVGDTLLQEYKLDEAEECFKNAYQKRDRIEYYGELLEENIGDLRILYKSVESLKDLDKKGNIYLTEGQYRDAARLFGKASDISKGSREAKEKHKLASSYATIKQLLEAGDFDVVWKKWNHANALYPKNLTLSKLKEQIIATHCDYLHELAAEAAEKGELLTEQDYLKEIMELNPNDASAEIRLKIIQKEFSKNIEKELDSLKQQFHSEKSIGNCEKIIQYIQDNKLDKVNKNKRIGRFLKHIKKTRSDIIFLNSKLEKYAAKGDIDQQSHLLVKAETKGWALPEGNPRELQNILMQQVVQTQLAQIQSDIKTGNIKEAVRLCLKLEHNKIDIETIKILREKAENLKISQNRRIAIKKEKKFVKQSEDKESINMEILKLMWEDLSLFRNELEIQGQLNDSKLNERYRIERDSLLSDTQHYMDDLRSNAFHFPEKATIRDARKNCRSMHDLITIVTLFDKDMWGEIEKWETWYNEYRLVLDWIEYKLPALRNLDSSVLLKQFSERIENNSAKQHILEVLSLAETSMDSLREKQIYMNSGYIDKSPVDIWLQQYMKDELVKYDFWKKLGKDVRGAELFVEDNQGSDVFDRECANALEEVKEIDSFLFNNKIDGDKSEFSIDQLKKNLSDTRKFYTNIERFNKLRNSDYVLDLENHIKELEKVIENKKDQYIKEYSKQIKSILNNISATGNDFQVWLSLEEEATDKITDLRQLDQVKADQMAVLLKEKLDNVQIKSGKELDKYNLMRLTELQRLECEGSIDLENSEPPAAFKDIISHYEKQREQMSFDLKHIPSDCSEVTLNKLLELRLKYGEYPELRDVIRIKKEESMKEKIEKQFAEFIEKWNNGIYEFEANNARQILAHIQSEYLSDSFQECFLKIENEIDNILFVERELSDEEFDDYLKDEKDDGVVKQWIEALEWLLKEQSVSPSLHFNFQHANMILKKIIKLQSRTRKLKADILTLWRHITFMEYINDDKEIMIPNRYYGEKIEERTFTNMAPEN